jgi:hypothetical protein
MTNKEARIRRLEAKILPKKKPRPLKIRFMLGSEYSKLEKAELDKSLKSLKLDFDDSPIMVMSRPGQVEPEDDGPTLTVRVVNPREEDQAAKQQAAADQVGGVQEPDDDELDTEIEKLEQRKAVLQREVKK